MRVTGRGRRRRSASDPALTSVVDEHRSLLRRRELERALGRALEQAETEDEVLRAVEAALLLLDPRRPYELHLVDRVEPVMDLAFATGATNPHAPERTSPWHALAAQSGQTLVFASTDTRDVCPHLADRIVEHCSAVSVPLLAMGRLIGVLHVMGPLGAPPPPRLVDTYETIARTTAAYLATVRAFGPTAVDAAKDAGEPPRHLDDALADDPDICDVTGLPGLAQATDSVSRFARAWGADVGARDRDRRVRGLPRSVRPIGRRSRAAGRHRARSAGRRHRRAALRL